MADDEVDVDAEATPDSNTVVALYDFDPASIDWPFRRQRPLPLQTGRVIQVIHDDGSEWALGFPAGQPELRGYFPKNYTISVAEYNAMREDYEAADQAAAHPADIVEVEDDELPGPPETKALPVDLPPMEEMMPMQDFDMFEPDAPELAIPGLAEYPVLEPVPPIATTFEVNKARLLREPPPVPRLRPMEPEPPSDPIDAALQEVEREALEDKKDPRMMPGGMMTDSRSSTPATHTLTRPERDFVRRHLPANAKDSKLQKLSSVKDIIMKQIRQAREEKPAYPADLRVRSTTCRVAAGIEPGIMRQALIKAMTIQARWKQMFRPQFNDIVNESFKVGCNPCILARQYLSKDVSLKENFQRIHVQDVNGTMWFELQRIKEHLFYMRMEGYDVMMCHPDAWGFPDTNRYVTAQPGEAFNPMHGWLHQVSIDADREMEDVEFSYTLRLRSFPENTFNALALGKVPKWIEPYTSLHGEASLEDAKPAEEGGDAGGKGLASDKALLAEAGLEDGDDVYVKLDELRLARERTVGPDVLDARVENYRLKGLSAMRIFLRSKGKPDNMKQTLLTPKIVKDMAAQLGIHGEHKQYWYCMFALRYPLAPEWEVLVKNDSRWYLHLPTDRIQPVHPLIREFRQHLNDTAANEFLWDFRGFVRMKCSQCGIPDSVLWCMQCTDYFCVKCFHQTHKSERGKKHWPMPTPGGRYLTPEEVERMKEHLPLLNIGFSNRRRFLAVDNQSDKMGSRTGDTWLYFDADSFGAAITQAPEPVQWHIKRTSPPRLGPDHKGYYYNFEYDLIADDSCYITDATHKQKALSTIQKTIRGAICRRRIGRETAAAVVIQKTKMMWDCQKIYGDTGKNANILKSWYRKYKSRLDKISTNLRIAYMQAVCRGIKTRNFVKKKMNVLIMFQGAFRGLRSRRRSILLQQSALKIQQEYRAHLHVHVPMAKKQASAAKIQAVVRAVAERTHMKDYRAKVVRIQCHYKGLRSRRRVREMHRAGLLIQKTWRRFWAQVNVKQELFKRMNDMYVSFHDQLNKKVQDAAAAITQRNYRRQRAYQKYMYLKREKGDADKRTQTLIVALFLSVGSLRQHVHPWWRHLPLEIQDVLEQIKNPMQRTIQNVPIQGKLCNEEIGRRGLRVAHVSNLTYKQSGKDPDLASHMLISVTRHLLSLVPPELFPQTVKWACYTIAHKAVDLSKKGTLKQDIIHVGKDMPPHPGDTLATLWDETASIKTEQESFIKMPEVSLPITVLHGLSPHHRQVFLTANMLITMRQALDSPSLSTEDHLKFQGLDISAGAQLMEVLGSEMDHALPLDWPKSYGTVASLAAQAATYVSELQPAKIKGHGGLKVVKADKKDLKAAIQAEIKLAEKEAGLHDSGGPKKKPKGKAKAKSKGKAKGKAGAKAQAADDLGHLAHFNRKATFRLVQQVGFLMSEQHDIINTVLAAEDGETAGQTIRTSRYITVSEKLFSMADNSKHDHCSFVLAVVLFHMVLRGLILRIMYHRAAIVVQKRYRYIRNRGSKANQLAPAITIQRFWRGLRAGLQCMKMIDAGKLIWLSYKAYRYNKKSKQFLHAILTTQRYWRGALSRQWVRHCHEAATFVQKFVRKLLIRVVLDKPGRDTYRKFQKEMTNLLKSKDSRSETEQIARTSACSAKCKVEMEKQRNRNVDMRRALSFNLRSKHTRTADRAKMLRNVGRVQPQRDSVFEPLVFGMARLQPGRLPPRNGGVQSRVLMQISNARRLLDKTLPPDKNEPVETGGWWCPFRMQDSSGVFVACHNANPAGMRNCAVCGKRKYEIPHGATLRGRAAYIAIRMVKTPVMPNRKDPLVNINLCGSWGANLFQPKGF